MHGDYCLAKNMFDPKLLGSPVITPGFYLYQWTMQRLSDEAEHGLSLHKIYSEATLLCLTLAAVTILFDFIFLIISVCSVQCDDYEAIGN